MEDLEVFHPDRMASRILDMGDVLTLIEQAERAFDADQAQRMADKVARGDAFTLEEFLEQMQAVKKMGSIGKLWGCCPAWPTPANSSNRSTTGTSTGWRPSSTR